MDYDKQNNREAWEAIGLFVSIVVIAVVYIFK